VRPKTGSAVALSGSGSVVNFRLAKVGHFGLAPRPERIAGHRRILPGPIPRRAPDSGGSRPGEPSPSAPVPLALARIRGCFGSGSSRRFYGESPKWSYGSARSRHTLVHRLDQPHRGPGSLRCSPGYPVDSLLRVPFPQTRHCGRVDVSSLVPRFAVPSGFRSENPRQVGSRRKEREEGGIPSPVQQVAMPLPEEDAAASCLAGETRRKGPRPA
jgi:hypothetical protein